MTLQNVLDMVVGTTALPNVFNPWRDRDELDGLYRPEDARRVRLLSHFQIAAPRYLLIGEAPGYQGCRFSGVAFTSERLILAGAVPRVHSLSGIYPITSRKTPWSEPSATIVWSALHAHGLAEHVVLWNAFPWHPHLPGKPYSNRKPTAAELEAGLPVLRAVVQHFDGVEIVAIGRTAEQLLKSADIPTHHYIRHPANGGAREFRDGIRVPTYRRTESLTPTKAHEDLLA